MKTLYVHILFVLYQFLFCFVNFFLKIGEKVYSQGVLERLGRVTVNTSFLYPGIKKWRGIMLYPLNRLSVSCL